jgi:hypothetical protein
MISNQVWAAVRIQYSNVDGYALSTAQPPPFWRWVFNGSGWRNGVLKAHWTFGRGNNDWDERRHQDDSKRAAAKRQFDLSLGLTAEAVRSFANDHVASPGPPRACANSACERDQARSARKSPGWIARIIPARKRVDQRAKTAAP